MPEQIKELLQGYYRKSSLDWRAVRIDDLVSMNTGWENELYSFDLAYESGGESHTQRLVLRIYPGSDAYDKSAHEYRSMQLLAKAGYPVPGVLALERDRSPFGKPLMIMERVEGEELWEQLLDPDGKPRQEYLTLFCDLFLRLHALDWRPFADELTIGMLDNPYLFVDRWLNNAHMLLERFDQPGFLPLIHWLEERSRSVPCPHPSVLHWDFHPSNILLGPEGSPVVIDWTGLRVSDARFDLAWTLLLARSYLGQAWRDRILSEYEHLSGSRVEKITFFEICACIRRLFDVVLSISLGAEKLGMRQGAESIMEQQTEAIASVYAFLLDSTGIRIPEVDALLKL